MFRRCEVFSYEPSHLRTCEPFFPHFHPEGLCEESWKAFRGAQKLLLRVCLEKHESFHASRYKKTPHKETESILLKCTSSSTERRAKKGSAYLALRAYWFKNRSSTHKPGKPVERPLAKLLKNRYHPNSQPSTTYHYISNYI